MPLSANQQHFDKLWVRYDRLHGGRGLIFDFRIGLDAEKVNFYYDFDRKWSVLSNYYYSISYIYELKF